MFVGLKAFQQLNVILGRYWAIVPTSMAMAFTEIYVIANVVRVGYSLSLVLAVGLGAGLGCIMAMLINKRMTDE